jgi:hypothetical protein
MSEPLSPDAPALPAPRPRCSLLIAATAAAVLLGVLATAWWFAAQRIEHGLRTALGPRGSVGTVALGWRGVELRELRITAARGWPAADELRAARVIVRPDLWAALTGRVALGRIVVEDGYVSLLRERNGRLRVLPALLGQPAAAGDGGAAFALGIGRIELRRGEVAFLDASVRRPPLAVRLTDFDAEIGPLALPALDAPVGVTARATVKGLAADGRSDGTLALDGEVTPATRDADLKLVLRRVDLRALQPYLMSVADGGVKRGRMDLVLAPIVRQQQLKAPGRLTLTGLELGSGGLAGVPRQAVLAFMSQNDRIELDFTLEGRLDDPAFSLNENLATRVASGLAGKLGVSVGGVVEGVGSVIKGLFGN